MCLGDGLCLVNTAFSICVIHIEGRGINKNDVSLRTDDQEKNFLNINFYSFCLIIVYDLINQYQ